MKTLIAAALLFTTPVLASVNTRAAHQQARITQGVASGELTRPEAARMQRQHNQLERQIARDRADGAGLTAHERAKIQRHENRLSRRIAVQKHDRQDR